MYIDIDAVNIEKSINGPITTMYCHSPYLSDLIKHRKHIHAFNYFLSAPLLSCRLPGFPSVCSDYTELITASITHLL